MDRPGIKNWHWRTKALGPWARSWFDTELPTVSTGKTKVVRVKDIEEDCCELGMRKSKVRALAKKLTKSTEDSNPNAARYHLRP